MTPVGDLASQDDPPGSGNPVASNPILGPEFSNPNFHTSALAVNVVLRWEYRLHRPSHSGLMATAGGLVFGSNLSSFFALGAKNGGLLWRFETGGGIDANPISYMSQGKQYVAIAAGHALLVFGLD